MNISTRFSFTDNRFVIGLLIFGLLLGGVYFSAGVGAARQVRTSAAEKLLTIHDGSRETSFISSARTLGAALKDGGIKLEPYDKVEPGLDEELIAASYDVNVYRARPVIVRDGSRSKRILSASRTGDMIAKDAGMTLNTEDLVTIEGSADFIFDGAALKLTINRAVPVTLVLYGASSPAYTREKTVGEMLQAKGISLGKDDSLSIAADTPIYAGLKIELWRNGKQTTTVEEDVAFPVERIQDVDRDMGYQEIKTAGKLGRRTVTYEIEMRNGVEISRRQLQSVMTQEPEKQVVVIGTKAKSFMSPAQAQQLGRQMMLAAGFGEDQWPCLLGLWMRESGWRVTADNPTSEAYGIPQALPGSKMGPGWQNDASVQISWGLGYIRGRYQTPCNADSIQRSRGWY